MDVTPPDDRLAVDLSALFVEASHTAGGKGVAEIGDFDGHVLVFVGFSENCCK
jgi:hypothetical protein